jgi:hypothetical protein
MGQRQHKSNVPYWTAISRACFKSLRRYCLSAYSFLALPFNSPCSRALRILCKSCRSKSRQKTRLGLTVSSCFGGANSTTSGTFETRKPMVCARYTESGVLPVPVKCVEEISEPFEHTTTCPSVGQTRTADTRQNHISFGHEFWMTSIIAL